jgi:hypothetical protein
LLISRFSSPLGKKRKNQEKGQLKDSREEAKRRGSKESRIFWKLGEGKGRMRLELKLEERLKYWCGGGGAGGGGSVWLREKG